uniref:ATP synthase F0 subunit 6 n=1 Tax=Cosmolaelaps hrdyi TaxID=3126097 RepID=UPI0030DE729F
MFLNLFSMFDPSTSSFFSNNWLSMMLFLFFIPLNFWIFKSRIYFFLNLIISSLLLEFKNNFSKNNSKSFIFFMSLFFYIFLNNFLGLFPYTFTASSHISFSLSIALPFWLTFMIFGWINFSNAMFSHLVPMGTPFILTSFMVLIETISNIIRPLTLAVRLTANMIAGHLLLCLLSNISEKIYFYYFITFPILIALLILELAVALIQSYVFITLLTLYFNEI